MMTTCLAALAVVALITTSSDARQAATGNWPQWRGPDGLGISQERGFVREWTPTTNILWKTAIAGRGLSSPVVWGDHVFVTTSVKGAPEPGRKAQVHLGFDYLPGYVHPDAVDIEFRHSVSVHGNRRALGQGALGTDAV